MFFFIGLSASDFLNFPVQTRILGKDCLQYDITVFCQSSHWFCWGCMDTKQSVNSVLSVFSFMKYCFPWSLFKLNTVTLLGLVGQILRSIFSSIGTWWLSTARPLIHRIGPMSVFICKCPLPMHFFFLRGLGRSVPCPWTGAERPLPLRGALRTGRCSELGAIPPSSEYFRSWVGMPLRTGQKD